MNTTIAENTQNVYHVTRQNLYFVQNTYNKKKLKMGAKEWNDNIWSRNHVLWTGLGGGDWLLTLCKVSTT